MTILNLLKSLNGSSIKSKNVMISNDINSNSSFGNDSTSMWDRATWNKCHTYQPPTHYRPSKPQTVIICSQLYN